MQHLHKAPAETSLQNQVVGVSNAEDYRRSHLSRLIGEHEQVEPRLTAGATQTNEVAILVPSYHDKSKPRDRMIQTTLDSIAHQIHLGLKIPIKVVIADNGLLDSERANIADYAKGISRRCPSFSLEFADAHHGGDRGKQNAAYARNMGLRHIFGRAEQVRGEGLRGEIALIDDDAAFLPGCLHSMFTALRGHPGAVASEGTAIGVSDLVADYQRNLQIATPIPSEAEIISGSCELPSLTGAHGVDLGSIVAFSGQIATKTACLLLARHAVERLTRNGEEIFVRFPHGSFEDMALGLGLSRLGKVVYSPSALYLDHVPELKVCMLQKSRWGRDHVIALNDFAVLEAINPGIHVLVPVRVKNEGFMWGQYTIKSENTGVVINPGQLKSLIPVVEKLSEGGTFSPLGEDFAPQKISRGIKALQEVLKQSRVPADQVVLRPDLPLPVDPDGQARFQPEHLACQLAGNLIGLQDLPTNDSNIFPSRFLFGVRQSASYPTRS
jgi:hypothetical protein